MYFKKNVIPFILLFLAGSFLAFLLKDKPVGDFGNYYYGSRLISKGEPPLKLYQDTHWFNEQIKGYGETAYFENYAPVPPFSLVFYYAFIILESHWAKLVFNILSWLVFCFSFYRFIKFANLKQELTVVLIVLITMAVPIYNNFLQGQSYILITALLLEVFLMWQKGNFVLTGIFIALVLHLKLFPGFILLFFFFNKEYKLIVYSMVSFTLMLALTWLVTGWPVISNYTVNVMPRFFMNEIVDPFYYGHQSIDIFFKNMFVADGFGNPNPLIKAPLLYVICKSIALAVVIYLTSVASKVKPAQTAFGAFMLIAIMFGSYITSYSLVLLLPFLVVTFRFKRKVYIFLLLIIGLNIPLSALADTWLVIKYSRIILLTLAFVFLIVELKPKINYIYVSAIAALLCTLNFFNMQEPVEYLPGQERKGIPYEIELKGQDIIVYRCMGEKDYVDTLKLNTSISKADKVNFKNKTGTSAYCINDSLLIYLSDYKQGVGMNKVMIKPLGKEAL